MSVILDAVNKYFKIKERGSTIPTEIRAGLVTFITMCYILFINADMISKTGGTCPKEERKVGSKCVDKIKEDLVTATAVSSFVGTFLMGVWANLPHGLAPGMGMNAYFAYTVVGFMGAGNLSYESALTCVFLEGIIFII